MDLVLLVLLFHQAEQTQFLISKKILHFHFLQDILEFLVLLFLQEDLPVQVVQVFHLKIVK